MQHTAEIKEKAPCLTQTLGDEVSVLRVCMLVRVSVRLNLFKIFFIQARSFHGFLGVLSQGHGSSEKNPTSLKVKARLMDTCLV